jgi:hypothetical protein
MVASAAAVGAALGTLLLVTGTGHGSAPAPRPVNTAVSSCALAPAPCGTNSLDELAIHAAYQAAQRWTGQTSGATSTPNPAP